MCPAVLPEALSHQGSSSGVQKAVSVRTESQAAGWRAEERYSEQPGVQKQAAFCLCLSAGSDQNNKYYLGTKPIAK